MAVNDEGQGTVSADTTLDDAARGFAALLSDDLEDKKPSETPPKPPADKPAPTASESDDEEEAPEAPDSEDKTADTDEESESANEEPDVAAVLDPALKVRVVIDGVEQTVTLEEALKGYSRTADYTRKTQEVAAQRKAQDAEFQAVRGERAKYAALMTQLEQALQEPAPDWARIQREQPEEFPTLWASYQQRETERAAVAEERVKAQEAVQRDKATEYQQYVETEQAKLFDAIPEWKDADKAKAEKSELVAFAKELGFSQEELKGVADHRLVVLLRKAMLHDKAQAKRPAIVQQIEKIKTATPGPKPTAKKPTSDVTKARQRLAKTGSIDDAAAGFAMMLDDSL